MPEIGEVARIVHYLKKHVVGRTIAAVKVQEDDIVYGKVGTSASAFQAAMTGKKVLDARQQGKYFWLVMSSPPHPLMHFGMTGWMKFSNDDTSYYKPAKKDEEQWPPKFWKFVLEMTGELKCEAAFVDSRRLARIRLIDVPADEMRKTSPLKDNGPDPVIDQHILTSEWLEKKMLSKRVPVKALLLDQANISGVGNWVGDEVLYQAKIHPEQYSNTFNKAQIKQLHDALINVCTTAVETLADSSKFPENWLMRYRWDKGKKNASLLPNGEKIVHLKVGGRTSAIVPTVQKKTGPTADDGSPDQEVSEDATDGTDAKPDTENNVTTPSSPPSKTTKRGRGKKSEAVNGSAANTKRVVEDADADADADQPVSKRQKGGKSEEAPENTSQPTGRRRSARISRS